MTSRPNVSASQFRLGASIAVFEAGAVLLVKRARAPFSGLWSLPGGNLESGECPCDAILRELLEETGIDAGILGLLEVVDIEAEDAYGDKLVYRLSVFYGTATGGRLAAGSDAAAARWVKLADLETIDLTPGTAALIRRAQDRLRASPA